MSGAADFTCQEWASHWLMRHRYAAMRRWICQPIEIAVSVAQIHLGRHPEKCGGKKVKAIEKVWKRRGK